MAPRKATPKPASGLTEKDRGILVEAHTNVLTPQPETHGREEIRTAAEALKNSGRSHDAIKGGREGVSVVQPETTLKGE